ncbi:MAG: gamma-butyrobetaine hydroxylase-like domain-containing protein [Porticoccaceae bacterium]
MTEPVAVKNSLRHQCLTLQWSAREIQRVSHARLRGACPCAKCRAARLQGHIPLVEGGVRLEAINPMGYGVQLVFSDGHDRGIYPWVYLRSLADR